MVMTLGTFTAVAQVQSLVGELRSCKPHGAAKKKKAAADGGGINRKKSQRGRVEDVRKQLSCL